MNRLSIPILVFLTIPALTWTVSAQVTVSADNGALPAEVVFGVIPDSLFEVEANHDFPYEYLFSKTDIRFTSSDEGITAILDYHVRLKIYSDDPIEQAQAALIGVPYYFLDGIEQVSGIEAVTHHPDGSKSRFDVSGISTVDLNSRYRILEFLVPGAGEGSVIEYRYRLSRRYIEELPDIYLSNRVPTRLAHVSLYTTDFLRYNVVTENIGFDLHFLEQSTDTTAPIRPFSINRGDPNIVQHWFARNIPAVGDPAYVSTVDDLRGKLKFQMSEFGRPRQPLQNSWDFVAAQIRRGENNPFETVNSLPEIREIGRIMADRIEDEEALVDSVFYYLNRRMTTNESRGVFPSEELLSVLNGEPSGQPAINTVLLAMLDGAGVRAWPVYLSGRSAGRINLDFPSLFQFNQMLVYVENETGGVLMDASFPHSRPGLIPVDAYNENGMLFRQDGYEWIDIRPEHSRFDLDLLIEGQLNDEGDFTGRLRAITGGYPAQQIRSELSGGKQGGEVIREAFFDAYTDIQIDHADIREVEEDAYPLMIEAEFEIPRYAYSFQEGLQFRPMIVGYLSRNPFEESTRSAPVILDAPEQLSIEYRISLPQEYQMEDMNESSEIRARGATLSESYQVVSDELRYSFDVDIERHEFPAGEYTQLKNLYDRWVYLSGDEWFIEKVN